MKVGGHALSFLGHANYFGGKRPPANINVGAPIALGKLNVT